MKEITNQTASNVSDKDTLFERSDTLSVYIGLLSPLMARLGPRFGLPDMRYYVIAALTLAVIWMVYALVITIRRKQFSIRRGATLKSLWILALCFAMDILFIIPD